MRRSRTSASVVSSTQPAAQRLVGQPVPGDVVVETRLVARRTQPAREPAEARVAEEARRPLGREERPRGRGPAAPGHLDASLHLLEGLLVEVHQPPRERHPGARRPLTSPPHQQLHPELEAPRPHHPQQHPKAVPEPGLDPPVHALKLTFLIPRAPPWPGALGIPCPSEPKALDRRARNPPESRVIPGAKRDRRARDPLRPAPFNFLRFPLDRFREPLFRRSSTRPHVPLSRAEAP